MIWHTMVSFNDEAVPGQLVKLSQKYLDYIKDGSYEITCLGLFETCRLLDGNSNTPFITVIDRDDICTLLARIDVECVSMILTPERKFGWIRSSALCPV